jgi:hypothetical protein
MSEKQPPKNKPKFDRISFHEKMLENLEAEYQKFEEYLSKKQTSQENKEKKVIRN